MSELGERTSDAGVAVLDDDWCAHRFDHLSPALAADLHGTLARMRERHPVAWSEEHGGFWVVTR